MKRYVFNFAIRDKCGDSIPVNCWGTLDYVSPMYEKCYIGAQGISNVLLYKIKL